METLTTSSDGRVGSRDFWLSCGHHLLDRDAAGCLVVTDEFLKAYFARQELVPPDDACEAELALRAKMLEAPRSHVPNEEIAAIVDGDARENWQLILAWRDHLLRHSTLEAAYVDLAHDARGFPSLFLAQLIQVILRNILEGRDDAYVLRAAELFFRPQRLILHQGSLISADEETHASLINRPVSPIDMLLGLSAGAQIDVLNDTLADSYFERSDRFDLGLDLTAGRRGLFALSEVVRRWVHHLLKVAIRLEPLLEVREAPFRWYVGLDAEATRLGDTLWRGGALQESAMQQLVGLYAVDFEEADDAELPVTGHPGYLLLAMSSDMTLNLKPQNLLTGLPVRQRNRWYDAAVG